MIGLKPKPLALSLYKELITNKVWAQSRFEYGYKDLRSHQLMNTFLGTPYIDLGVISIHGFQKTYLIIYPKN